jgi:hypothetical protein
MDAAAKLSPSTRPRRPANPWSEHLRSLVGQPVVIFTMGPAALIEFKGRLLAISDQHMNCALFSEGQVITLKNVHHIVSPAVPGRPAGAR